MLKARDCLVIVARPVPVLYPSISVGRISKKLADIEKAIFTPDTPFVVQILVPPRLCINED